MFERNIEETIAFLRKETIDSADSITSRQIFASSMPSAIKRMFETDIDIWVREERERLLQSPHFRYDEAEVESLFAQIGAKARDYAVFSAAEYDAALEKNVKLLFNYVCRPQWTLVKYLFAEREHAATDDILEALRSFWHYEYYQIILREYFEKKKLSVINVKKFTDLIEHIDLEVVRNFDSRKTGHLAEPLFELFNLGENPEESTAPIEALSIFYDDKNLTSIVERLDQEKQHHERMALHDLVMLVSEADFTLGVDISTIVNEQLKHGGGMKPERTVTAGEDFDVPSITEGHDDEVHHGDLGHEHDALDFIISDEEQGVIVQEGDHITHTLAEDIEEDMQRRDELRLMTMEEEDEDAFSSAGDDQEMAVLGESIVEDAAVEEMSEAELDGQSDSDAFSFTDESILSLEAEFDSSSDYVPEQSTDNTSFADDDEAVPEIVLGDDEDTPTDNYLSSKDEIPDITLEELGSIRFGDEADADTSFTEEDEIDPYMTSAVVDELAGTDVLLGDEIVSKPAPSADEIDWDKEAEDMEDINLDDVDDDGGKLSDSLPGVEDALQQAEQLKPAEELLGELDLDDFETTPAQRQSRQYDIPIIEDESPLPQRSPASDTEEEEAEDTVSAEEVIREFGDLNQLLPASDRKKYAKKLFNKNEDAFNRAIQTLNGKATWRQASEYIDGLFIKYDVDMYSRLAVKFTDDIYKRYASKK